MCPAPTPRERRWPRRLASPVLGLLLLGACGGPEGQPDGAGPPPAPRWRVPLPSVAEQARYALDRLLTGPVPQSALVIPEQHAEVLRASQRDLVVLGEATLALLSDERLRERLTGPTALNLDPWHNVLDVLAALREKPVELCLGWAGPALGRDEPSLSLRAVDVLAGTRAPEAGPLLLAFLERAADDRALQRQAWRALARLPDPWPERALARLRRFGLPEVWLDVAPLLGERLESAGTRDAAESLLAWWALLTDVGGPRGTAGQPRQKTLPWSLLRAATAPGAPGAGPPGGGVPRLPGPFPASVSDGLGWLSAEPGASPVLAPTVLLFVATEPGADARCQLAGRGHRAFVAAVEADRASDDPVRREHARHCMLGGGPAVSAGERLEATAALLARVRAAGPEAGAPTASEVAAASRSLPLAADPGGPALLARVLAELRPVAHWLGTLEAAYAGLLAAQDGSAQDLLRRWLAGAEPVERGLALQLAQRSRDPSLLPQLEALAGGGEGEAQANARRVLWWVHAGGGAEPGLTADFARRYAAEVEAAGDARAAALASGLLDLGEPGQRLFVAGLSGPRRKAYLEAALSTPGVLPLLVAEGLADSVAAGRPAEERRAALLALWRAAPSDAAPAVAAIQARLDPAERAAVEVVVQHVRHRAAR